MERNRVREAMIVHAAAPELNVDALHVAAFVDALRPANPFSTSRKMRHHDPGMKRPNMAERRRVVGHHHRQRCFR